MAIATTATSYDVDIKPNDKEHIVCLSLLLRPMNDNHSAILLVKENKYLLFFFCFFLLFINRFYNYILASYTCILYMHITHFVLMRYMLCYLAQDILLLFAVYFFSVCVSVLFVYVCGRFNIAILCSRKLLIFKKHIFLKKL